MFWLLIKSIKSKHVFKSKLQHGLQWICECYEHNTL